MLNVGSASAIELRHLRYFSAVADAGQISLAARRLYMTQPALSQALQQLERGLGVELVRRHPRGVALTRAGEEVLVEARAAIAAVDRATAAAAAFTHGRHERLVVGFLVESLEFLLEPLARFARARPDVHVEVRELTFANQEAELREGRVDIALLVPPPADLNAHVLAYEPLELAVRADHDLVRAGSVTVGEIGDEPFAAAPPGAPEAWTDVYWLTAARGERPRLGADAPATPQEAGALLAAGRVVSATPAFVMRHYRGLDVAAVPLRGVEPVAVGFAWMRERPVVRAFVESLRVAALTEPHGSSAALMPA